jgi:hypothetical protein
MTLKLDVAYWVLDARIDEQGNLGTGRLLFMHQRNAARR